MQSKKELLFFIPYCLYLALRLIDTSTFQALFVVTDTYNMIMRVILVLCIGLKLLLEFKEWKNYAHIWIPLLVLFLLVVYISKHTLLLDIFVLLIGAWNIDIKKIVRVFCIEVIPIYLLFIVLALNGVILNQMYWYDDFVGYRYSFGSTYPTDFCAMIFYVQISLAFVKEKRYSLYEALFWILVAINAFTWAHGRLDFVLMLAFTAVWFLKGRTEIFDKAKTMLLKWVMPVGCLGTFVLYSAYNESNVYWQKLNSIMSSRLSLGKGFFDDYGYPVFGTNIEMIGNGWSIEGNSSFELGNYSFIDSGFLNIGLQYGILFLLVVVICYAICSWKTSEKGNFELGIIVVFLTITSIVDQHLFEVAFNPFMFTIPMAISYFPLKKKGT